MNEKFCSPSRPANVRINYFCFYFEINENFSALHAQQMYESMKTQLEQVLERNNDLEMKVDELTKIYTDLQRMEQELREELASNFFISKY